eukprot:3405674-Rhodomonas_salina.2
MTWNALDLDEEAQHHEQVPLSPTPRCGVERARDAAGVRGRRRRRRTGWRRCSGPPTPPSPSSPTRSPLSPWSGPLSSSSPAPRLAAADAGCAWGRRRLAGCRQTPCCGARTWKSPAPARAGLGGWRGRGLRVAGRGQVQADDLLHHIRSNPDLPLHKKYTAQLLGRCTQVPPSPPPLPRVSFARGAGGRVWCGERGEPEAEVRGLGGAAVDRPEDGSGVRRGVPAEREDGDLRRHARAARRLPPRPPTPRAPLRQGAPPPPHPLLSLQPGSLTWRAGQVAYLLNGDVADRSLFPLHSSITDTHRACAAASSA